jgi:hypothetical protein
LQNFGCAAEQNTVKTCFCWHNANILACGRTKCRQFELLLLANVKVFAAQRNKIQCFCSQFQRISLRGGTAYSAFVRNSYVFAAEQNGVKLNCFCRQIPRLFAAGGTKYSRFELLLLARVKIFAARQTKIQCLCSQFKRFSMRGRPKYSTFVCSSKRIRCAEEQDAVKLNNCFFRQIQIQIFSLWRLNKTPTPWIQDYQ